MTAGAQATEKFPQIREEMLRIMKKYETLYNVLQNLFFATDPPSTYGLSFIFMWPYVLHGV